MRKAIIGIMGPGSGASPTDLQNAQTLGLLIADMGWALLTGGRREGVMHFASKGAHERGGLVVGILPSDDDTHTSEYVDISVKTGMGSARNYINILTSDVVIACGMGAGTASEVALALKGGKNVILLTESDEAQRFFKGLRPDLVQIAGSPEEAIELTKKLLAVPQIFHKKM